MWCITIEYFNHGVIIFKYSYPLVTTYLLYPLQSTELIVNKKAFQIGLKST
jgi:hypothetical protein